VKTRTFVAVPIPDDVRGRALEFVRSIRPVAGDVKWVESHNLHWTLNFLGDVDDTELPDVCDAVAAAAAEIEPFELECRGAGAFPSADRPRTLWLGAGEGSDRMVALQAAIERALSKLGFRGEARHYTPHLTLGRAGRGQPPRELAAKLAELADFDAGTMLVDEVTIFASQLTPAGPVYDVLALAPLAP
jgi:2'-5' RNA ligase